MNTTRCASILPPRRSQTGQHCTRVITIHTVSGSSRSRVGWLRWPPRQTTSMVRAATLQSLTLATLLVGQALLSACVTPSNSPTEHAAADPNDTPSPTPTGPDANADIDPTADTDITADTDPTTDTDLPPPPAVVVAGDSWSAGLVAPLRQAMDDAGFADVPLRAGTTARAGSEARAWRADEHPPALAGGVDTTQPPMLTALRTALDDDPPATLLLLVLGGNDLNFELADGLGTPSATRTSRLNTLLSRIQADLAFLIDDALTGRPQLQVVIVGYSYFHFDILNLMTPFAGFTFNSYNEAFIDLESRKRDLALSRSGVWYAQHFGLLQRHYGDAVNPPWSRPNGIDYPTYGPNVAPAPGQWPHYDPFPGGFYTYPGPLAAMPDGIHPHAEANRVIVDHMVSQGLFSVLQGGTWGPP